MNDRRSSAKDLLLFLPRCAALLGRLLADPGVPASQKALLAATIAYVASPVDLIPDFVPVVGQLDDLYLVALVLLRFVNRAGQERLRRYWDGPENLVGLPDRVTGVAVALLPPRVRRLVERRVAGAPAPAPADGTAPGAPGASLGKPGPGDRA